MYTLPLHLDLNEVSIYSLNLLQDGSGLMSLGN